MGFKIELSKEKLNKLKDEIGRDERMVIKFYDEKKEYLEEWDIMYEITIKEHEEVKRKVRIVEVKDEMEENHKINENNDEGDKLTEEEELEMEDREMSESEPESEEEVIQSEKLQILISKLNQKKEKINERIMEESGENLSLKQLCQRIRRRNQMLLEDYYYVGEKFGKRLKEEINKRKRKDRKRKTDQEERKGIYKEMMETGVERSMKALKRMVEKGEKVYRLIEGVGKERLKSMCDITAVESCNREEIEKAIEHFRN